MQNTSAEQSPTNIFNEHASNPIFKRKDPLSNEFTPTKDNFLCRDKEIEKIARKFQDMINGGSGENCFITGNTGVGKTACVKIVLKDLQQAMQSQNFQYIHMEDLSSQRDALREISESLGLDYKGNDLHRYYTLLENKLTEEDIKLVIVIDEFDSLFTNSSKDHGNALLKRLYETRASVMNAGKGGLVVVGITNHVNTTGKFNSKVRSRYGTETIHFSVYNALELRKILETRKQQAFKPHVVDEGVVSKIAAIVAAEDGDARSAIELLKTAGEIAVEQERERVTSRHVDQARERLEEDKTLEAIKQQSKQAKILLYTIISMEEQKAASGDLYQCYEKVCEEHDIEPRTQRRIRQIILDLDMMGLIQAKIEGIPEGGRTRTVKSNHDDDLESEIKTMIEEDVFRA